MPRTERPLSAKCRRRSHEARCSAGSSSTQRDRAPKSIDGFVAGSRLAAIAGTLDRALRPDITVRTEIAPDLWDFNADPEELYFALLNLCRNAADAMPNGGTITVAARNVEPSSGAARGFVEIVVADDGEGMPEEVLSQAFTPYFTTKPAGGGTGLGLPQVQRFAEGRDGAVRMESEGGCRHAGAPLPAARASSWAPQQHRRHGDRVHAVTQRRRIPRHQPSDGCADVVAGANTWRPVQRCSS
jgi:signal transduction histidine kinase